MKTRRGFGADGAFLVDDGLLENSVEDDGWERDCKLVNVPTGETREIDGGVGNSLPNDDSVLDMEDRQGKSVIPGDLKTRKAKTLGSFVLSQVSSQFRDTRHG